MYVFSKQGGFYSVRNKQLRTCNRISKSLWIEPQYSQVWITLWTESGKENKLYRTLLAALENGTLCFEYIRYP